MEAFATHRKISQVELASALGIHQNTLSRYLKKYHITAGYSAISDEDLDELVRQYRAEKPQAGVHYLRGHLRAQHGLCVQKMRIAQSIHRVDPLGSILRDYTTVKRRQYRITHPNSLWHIDGHHKLIRWGIVIHGIIDGFCHTVIGLRASTNNTASTVLDLFDSAVKVYGLPSRVRGDRGEEVSYEENQLEIAESSSCAINEDCDRFCQDWNNHPISGKGHDKSPEELRFLGNLKEGVYDDYKEMEAMMIQRYYGADQGIRLRLS
ncbi:hypothetical protein D9758_017468 [Tetrapyrgos nigripes]|uniref:Integrase catalytic domain-containing protein n=1 Tax=Tetrapyrgos nigripes TaxID=182062 RepID=A0A8H5FEK1_9AGAR|nr:hypothetical protein D9758_017468 [Tetrapyrgos nigripes]